MKNLSSDTRTLALILLTIILCGSCKRHTIVVVPNPNNKIYAESNAHSGLHYYCYVYIQNFSSEISNLTLSKNSNYLNPWIPAPTYAPGGATTVAKYEIKGWDPTIKCNFPCSVGEINVNATWSNGDVSEGVSDVKWSNPVTQWEFWVPETPPNGNSNIYESVIIGYLKADINGGGVDYVYTWNQIDQIYNDNWFPIDILVAHDGNLDTDPCFSEASANEQPVYRTIQPYTFFSYGDTVRARFGTAETPAACLRDNSPFVFIKSQSSQIKSQDGVAWIALGVTLK